MLVILNFTVTFKMRGAYFFYKGITLLVIKIEFILKQIMVLDKIDVPDSAANVECLFHLMTGPLGMD